MASNTPKPVEPIAVIGLSFKFPGGAETTDEFWNMLLERRCAASEVPKDRFNVDAFWHPDQRKKNAISTRRGHFLSSDIKNFDAGFFSMAPHEVGSMDPQQRGLMETTYHAFENAGLSLKDVAGTRTSVHIGCFTSDFATMQTRDAQSIPKYNSLGTAGSMLANRISWFYDLHGESMYTDTACSSSLVALALACQGLGSGQSEMAVVGGSNIILIPEFSISLSNMNMLSPEGTSRSFDASGDGYGRGEGFATLVLQPVSKALAAGNPIRALIRSTGMNQDGHTSSGITQPSRSMQMQLIRETYRKAALDMKHTRFFEAHGTGTPVGDPTEARAIGEAFFHCRSKEDPIYVGAVKSNIGHLEGTSGLAGVVKAILALERGIIPPNANFKQLNPQIDSEFLNLAFPTKAVPWPSADAIRRASVNSFGFGGSNAHVVLEAAESYLRGVAQGQTRSLLLSGQERHLHSPADTNGNLVNGHSDIQTNGRSDKSLSPRLLTLSAADEGGIARQSEQLSKLLSTVYTSTNTDTDSLDVLEDIAFTLNTRRSVLGWKSYAVVQSINDIKYLPEMLSKPLYKPAAAASNVGLVFTGQGAQWPRMAYELLDWPVFAASMSRSQKFLNMFGCDWLLKDEIAAVAESSRMHTPELSQAITTAVQIAIVDLLFLLDTIPAVVVGHSSGEIAAAYCAGFLCHESAMRASYFRGVVSSKLARESQQVWGMASVGIPAAELPHELQEFENHGSHASDANSITISCINSPTNTTVAGPADCLGRFVSYLSSRKVFARKLKVDVGYHSPQMDTIASEYLGHLSSLRPGLHVGRTKMVSSVIPGLIDVDTVCSGEYWIRNMVSPVRFVEAIGACCTKRDDKSATKFLDRSHASQVLIDGWLEVGPHAALKGPLREICKLQNRSDLFYASFLVRNKRADETALHAIGQLLCQGLPVDHDRATRLGAVRHRQPRIVMDLPQYQFNHSVIHWEESARSRSFRSRTQRHHPLLGSQIVDWNPSDARWRLSINKEESPWISDHRVQGSMWYPAAGMIVMAVEALKQLLPDDQFDFEFQDVSFTAPIVLNDSKEGTETQISMAAAPKAGGRRDIDHKFRIFVRTSDDSWVEVCDGTICPHRTKNAALEVNSLDEEEHKRATAQAAYDSAIDTCQSHLKESEMYRKIDENMGLQYGPSFQALKDVYYDKQGEAHGILTPLNEDTAATSRPYTIHPATLDGIFQMAIPALSGGLTNSLPTMVPSRLTRLWLSRDGAGSSSTGPDSNSEVVHAQTTRLGKRSAVASTTVFSKADMQLRVLVEELESTAVATVQDENSSDQPARSVCHEMEWKVDLTLLNQAEVFDYCSQYRSKGPEPEEWYIDVRLMLLGFAEQALSTMRQSGQKPLPSMEGYASWLQARLNAHRETETKSQTFKPLPTSSELQIMADKFEKRDYRGYFGVLVGRKLREILVGETDPLQTLFADQDYLSNIYEEVNKTGKGFEMLHAYVDALVHKDPGLKFLEVGAGTGATTNMVLDMIATIEQGPRYSEYMFTDISSFFFPAAKERFKIYDRVQYRTLDIEQESFDGFEDGTYDVLVAANVLHTTRDLKTTLSNVRRLLKPSGKLLLVEMTTPNNVETGFVWGSLPGWWLGCEDFRRGSAVIDESRWSSLLKQAGFSGTDHVFRDWDSDVCHGWSVMVATATQLEHNGAGENGALQNGALQNGALTNGTRHLSPTDSTGPDITFIVESENCPLQLETAEITGRSVSVLGSDSQVVTFDRLLSSPGVLDSKHCVLLADLNKTHLHEMSSGTFKLYQQVLTASKSVLWVQAHDGQSPPYSAMAEGLCRVVRSENPFVKITNLTLDAAGEFEAERISTLITKVLRATTPGLNLPHQQVEDSDQEYLEVGGVLCVNRLRQARYLDEHVACRTLNPVRTRKFNSGLPLKLEIRTPGLLDTIEWVEDKAAYLQLEAGQLEIKVLAIGVNFKDCLTLLGRVSSDDVGTECAGYVTRVGSGVTKFRPGDRVAVGVIRTYQSLVRAREVHAVKIPDCISIEDAAGVPTAFGTAYHCLYTVARLQPGETILIHAAAGGTGQAAVQIAQLIGAEIFATVGSPAKKQLLMERYGIPEDHILYSRNASFADAINRMTGGRGVDVVLNSLSGKLLVASWEIIAEFGRFIEIGRKDIDTRGYLPMFPFIKNAMFVGIDLAAIVDGPGQRHMHILQKVFDLMASGKLRPSYPVKYYRIDQAEQALRLLVSGKSTGKMILTTEGDFSVPFKESEDSEYRFSDQATYVIAGGLGGIGRQIARWMVRRGARNILLLTRSGSSGNREKMKLVTELEAQGVNLQHGICDITDLGSVQDAVKAAARTMPPIRGCFQAAMVIQDRTFAAMSHQDWCESTEPKVKGTWNLHTALPKGMDYFVMLSSAVCIFGNAGQANYAAGNTFQDALARFRVSRGEKAVAIDLGMVLGEGWVAERAHMHHRVMQFDQVLPISQPDLFALFDYYCNPATEFRSPTASQIITGLELPSLIIQAGREVPDSMKRPLFRAMHQAVLAGDSVTAATTSNSRDFATIFENASSLEVAGEAVAEALKVKLCKILGVEDKDKTTDDRMDSFGVDSLIALEVRNWLAKEMRADLAVYEILGDVKLIDTGLMAAQKSEFRPAHWGRVEA